jgi:hypothetical protein
MKNSLVFVTPVIFLAMHLLLTQMVLCFQLMLFYPNTFHWTDIVIFNSTSFNLFKNINSSLTLARQIVTRYMLAAKSLEDMEAIILNTPIAYGIRFAQFLFIFLKKICS